MTSKAIELERSSDVWKAAMILKPLNGALAGGAIGLLERRGKTLLIPHAARGFHPPTSGTALLSVET